jgi:hypothetical protein
VTSAKSLQRFVRRVNRHVRRFNDLGDDTVALGPSANSELVSNGAGVPTAERKSGVGANPDKISFKIPKNFTVTADTSGRRLVLLNHRLENQEGYALSPDAAKQVAGGLTNSADAVLALEPSLPRRRVAQGQKGIVDAGCPHAVRSHQPA